MVAAARRGRVAALEAEVVVAVAVAVAVVGKVIAEIVLITGTGNHWWDMIRSRVVLKGCDVNVESSVGEQLRETVGATVKVVNSCGRSSDEIV